MDNSVPSSSSLVRMVGFMGIAVGLAWAFQILGFKTSESAADTLMWVLGAAALAGASFGLVVVSSALDSSDDAAMDTDRAYS